MTTAAGIVVFFVAAAAAMLVVDTPAAPSRWSIPPSSAAPSIAAIAPSGRSSEQSSPPSSSDAASDTAISPPERPRSRLPSSDAPSDASSLPTDAAPSVAAIAPSGRSSEQSSPPSSSDAASDTAISPPERPRSRLPSSDAPSDASSLPTDAAPSDDAAAIAPSGLSSLPSNASIARSWLPNDTTIAPSGRSGRRLLQAEDEVPYPPRRRLLQAEDEVHNASDGGSGCTREHVAFSACASYFTGEVGIQSSDCCHALHNAKKLHRSNVLGGCICSVVRMKNLSIINSRIGLAFYSCGLSDDRAVDFFLENCAGEKAAPSPPVKEITQAASVTSAEADRNVTNHCLVQVPLSDFTVKMLQGATGGAGSYLTALFIIMMKRLTRQIVGDGETSPPAGTA